MSVFVLIKFFIPYISLAKLGYYGIQESTDQFLEDISFL